MKPSDASSPSNVELARRRREEAQKLNIQKQALRIAQQRELAARQKEAVATGKSAQSQPKPLSARSVYTPPAAQPALLPKRRTAVVAPRPPAVIEQAVPAAHVPRRSGRTRKPVEPAPAFDANDIRAEMQEFAHETASVAPRAAAPLPAEPAVEISADDIVIESPDIDGAPLNLAPAGESDLAREMNSVEIISSAISDPPGLTKAETLKLKMVKGADLACPKCQSLIPEAQRGAYYTECRRCGEIIKMDAA